MKGGNKVYIDKDSIVYIIGSGIPYIQTDDIHFRQWDYNLTLLNNKKKLKIQ